MRNKITTAALVLTAALCTSANATTLISFSFTGSNNTSLPNPDTFNDKTNTYNSTTYTVTATGAVPSGTSEVKAGNLATTTTSGLGISQTNSDITDNEYIVLDFSSLATALGANVTAVSMGLSEVVSGPSSVNVYGTNVNPLSSGYKTTGSISGNANDTLLYSQSLNTQGAGALPVSLAGNGLDASGAYNYYIVDLTGTSCGVAITGVSFTTPNITTNQTPEPGTLVMAGMALIGLGLTMKKRRQKN